MRGRTFLMFAGCVGLITACESDGDVRARYSATLSGSAERPNPVTTNGTGTFTATLNSSNILSYNVQFSGLGSNVTLGHIHGPATVDQAVGFLVDFSVPTLGRTLTTGVTTGSAVGTVDLNTQITTTVSGDSLLTLLNNGRTYVNIHTAQNGGGEIRGQIMRQ